MKILRLIPLFGLLLLGGCRTPSSGPIWLGRGVPFVLRPPSEGPKLFTTQEVIFQLPEGREERLLTSMENDSDRLSIVASSPMGQTLFTLQLRQGAVTLDARPTAGVLGKPDATRSVAALAIPPVAGLTVTVMFGWLRA